jgi:hypothetical protein
MSQRKKEKCLGKMDVANFIGFESKSAERIVKCLGIMKNLTFLGIQLHPRLLKSKSYILHMCSYCLSYYFLFGKYFFYQFFSFLGCLYFNSNMGD